MKKLLILSTLILASYFSFSQKIQRKTNNVSCAFLVNQDNYNKMLLTSFNSSLEAKHFIGPPEPENEAATSLVALGDIYLNNKVTAKALENYTEAYKVLDNNQYENQLGKVAYKMGLIYASQQNTNEAVRLFNKAANCFEAIDFKESAAKCYIELATIERLGKNYKSAEYLIMKKGLPMCSPIDNPKCYDVLAHTYQDLSRFSEAKWFYLQVNTISRWRNDTAGIITSLTNLGRVKTSIKDYKLAVKDFKEAQTLAKTAKLPQYLPEITAALLDNKNQASGKKPAQKALAAAGKNDVAIATLASN